MHNIHLISASAGSGKTYSLTEKVLEAVQSGIAPERILAVTFTNKAAAELKERIRGRLTSQGDSKLLEKSGALADAYIGTVNSICARLLREFAFDAGDSPAVDIMPEQEAERLFRLSVAHVIDSHYSDLSGAARRLGRDGSGSGYAKKSDWRDDVHSIVDLARSNGLDETAVRNLSIDSVAGLKKHLGKPRKTLSNKNLLKLVRTAITEILAVDDETKTTRAALSALRQAAHGLEQGYILWADWRKLADISAGKSSGADAYLEPVREYASQLQHHPELHRDVETLINGVFSSASESLEAFASYKRINGLMDFTDQESKVLRLMDSEHVCRRLAENIDLVLVDEFQDTSPIQLALFGKLVSLVDRNIWVGDQKQAIYGFRGTDPKLMDDVIAQLNANQIGVLEDSYRSRPSLVAYANEVFVHALDGLIPAERVRLNPKRTNHAKQSEALGIWMLSGTTKGTRTGALADGIARLLRKPDHYQIEDRDNGELRPLKAGDIAVLSRSNDACREIAEALAGYGIRASVGRGALFAQPELIIALASLHLLADPSDRLALTELVNGLPEHASSKSWLTELAHDPEHAPDQWKQDKRIRRLLDVKVVDQSPLELFELVGDIMDLEGYAFKTANPPQTLANIEALSSLIGDYQGATKARHEATTLPGLMYWLGQQDDPGMPEGQGKDTVQVLTYHRSKGLEWPLVILNDLDSQAKFSPFGVTVTAAKHFDPAEPLAGRGIRFWPEPFNGKGLPFGESIEGSDEYAAAETREAQERQRLMYVGMTRARDYLIHAIPYYTRKKSAPPEVHADWLDALIVEDGRIRIPDAEDDPCAITVGEAQFPCIRTVHTADENPEPLALDEPEWFTPMESKPVDYESYRISPSSHDLPEAEKQHVQTAIAGKIGNEIDIHQHSLEMNLLGEAIHRFIAADHTERDRKERQEIAARMLDRWVPESGVNSDQLLAISDNFHHWVKQTYPDARLLKEWPVRMKTGNRAAHGWIDALIETNDGYVLVDHKTMGADIGDCLEQVKSYAGQLNLYSRAIRAATGKPVMETLIHLPLQGNLISVNTDA